MASSNPTLSPGLINTAPGMTDTLPGTPPAGASSGSPVTGYNPASGTASPAVTSTYDPKAFQVTPDQTVVSQLHNIIDSGSPLMQQAETRAKNAMNARGLINSSQAVGAGQDAVTAAALPIAQQDASTYATAASNTTGAQNTALAAESAAKNTAGLQDAQLQTGTSQFNAGQQNAALSAASGASNQVALQAQQNEANLANIKTNRAADIQIAQLQEANKNVLQSSSIAGTLYNTSLANLSSIISNPNLSEEQKTTALNDGIAQLNDALSVISKITNTPGVASLLTFGGAGAASTTPQAVASSPNDMAGPQDTSAQSSGIINTPTAQTAAPAPAATGGQPPGVAAALAAPPRTGGGNTPAQDVAQALKLNPDPNAISPSSWAQMGYTAGGAAPLPVGQGIGVRNPLGRRQPVAAP